MEKIITINLRKLLVKEPNWKRADAASQILKKILQKRTKANKIKINKGLNEFIWRRGIKNPPAKLRIKLVESDKFVTADLMD